MMALAMSKAVCFTDFRIPILPLKYQFSLL
jgi:hypothetical protein